MNQIERVELIKAVFKRLYARFEKEISEIIITDCSMDHIRGVKEGMEDSAEIIQKEEKDQLDYERIEQIIGQRLSFSKRMAICRMFNHWFNSNPTNSRYSLDMFLISYLDKKGWLNIQKIQNQMTDSRIKAILGEGIADKLINDDKKEETDTERLKTKIEKIRKKHDIKKLEEENEV